MWSFWWAQTKQWKKLEAFLFVVVFHFQGVWLLFEPGVHDTERLKSPFQFCSWHKRGCHVWLEHQVSDLCGNISATLLRIGDTSCWCNTPRSEWCERHVSTLNGGGGISAVLERNQSHSMWLRRRRRPPELASFHPIRDVQAHFRDALAHGLFSHNLGFDSKKQFLRRSFPEERRRRKRAHLLHLRTRGPWELSFPTWSLWKWLSPRG